MGLLDGVDLLLELPDGLGDVGGNALLVFLRKVDEDLQVVPEGRDRSPLRNDGADPGFLRLEVSGLGRVFPDIRLCQERVYLCKPFFARGDFKDTPAWPGGARRWM
jgi:hypothetical protein